MPLHISEIGVRLAVGPETPPAPTPPPAPATPAEPTDSLNSAKVEQVVETNVERVLEQLKDLETR